MAYSDSGAYVFKDGVRRTDREDVGVFDDQDKGLPSGVRVFANLSRRLAAAELGLPEPSWALHSHHAVLGDHDVRLCGYKSRPELWAMTYGEPGMVDLDSHVIDRDDDGDPIAWAGARAGYTFEVFRTSLASHPHELIALRMVEPDGSVWTSHCGYLYGAGHLDRDPAHEATSKHWWLGRLADEREERQ